MSDAVKVREKNGLERPYQRRTVAPPVDVLENADEVLIVADVPGVPNEAIDVQVENDTLTLQTRRLVHQEDAPPALAREYEGFDYVRSFRIPAGIDTPNIRAHAKNGTLRVVLPKTAVAKPRKVDVRAS